MRLQEFADAEDQIKLWKLISDSVWDSIKLQAIEQEKATTYRPNKQKKTKSATKLSKNPKTVAAPKPKKQPKSQPKSDKSAIPTKQQKSAPQSQKQQVLPKVFSNTSKSNLATPQTPVTSSSSLLAQSAAKTRAERLTHDPNSVANIQYQLDPLANNDVVKRLTS